jgi:quinol monooxygenase YgiN
MFKLIIQQYMKLSQVKYLDNVKIWINQDNMNNFRRNQMIIVTATITANPDERDKIIKKSQDLIESTRLESGCISYNLYASTEDDNILLMLERWENQEVLESHMQTKHFKAFGADIKNLLARKLDIDVCSADKI